MTFKFENQKYKQGFAHIIGCDEVGRGCLAGPVVAAAVSFPAHVLSLKSSTRLARREPRRILNLKGIKDSKLLTAGKREELSEIIKQNSLWSIGIVSQGVVDEINIHNATLLAMRRAVEGLLKKYHPVPQKRDTPPIIGGEAPQLSLEILRSPPPEKEEWIAQRDDVAIVIDGKFTIPNLKLEQEAIVGGDNKILSIAAASIVAKVYRDGLMRKLHKQYPIYNFAQHKGYGTLHHRTMILQNGLSSIHRKSFCKNLAPI